MNKKGATVDNFWVMIQFFGLALFFLIIFLAWSNFTSSELNADLWDSSIGGNIKQNTTAAINNLDNILIIAYFAVHLGVIIMAFLLRSHPIVYVAGIFLVVILVMISAPISNAWEEITTDADFVSSASSFPKTNFVMDKFPMLEAFWAFLTLISLAAFARSEGMI